SGKPTTEPRSVARGNVATSTSGTSLARGASPWGSTVFAGALAGALAGVATAGAPVAIGSTCGPRRTNAATATTSARAERRVAAPIERARFGIAGGAVVMGTVNGAEAGVASIARGATDEG